MLALRLHPDKPQNMEAYSEKTNDILNFCYKAINCDTIEIVHPNRLPHPYCMIVDEEGLLKDLPLNPMASVLYETDIHGQPIVGTAIIMKEAMTEDGPDIVSLDAEDLERLLGIATEAVKQAYEEMNKQRRRDA